jgi:hypothetical protein
MVKIKQAAETSASKHFATGLTSRGWPQQPVANALVIPLSP